MPLAVRQRYLKLLHEYDVRYVFAGHDHRNYELRDGDLTIVVSGPVGKPLSGGKSGIRIITVTPDGLQHAYRDFGDLP
jgi:predicted phosphodiesterase